MITTQNLGELRPLNFGIRTLRERPSVEALARQVARYDPADAAAVSRLVCEEAGHETLVDELVAVYQDVLAERCGLIDDPQAEQRAASLYLQSLADPLLQHDLLRGVAARLFRIPFVRTLLRRRAERAYNGLPLHQLLKSFEQI
jgi:hypothetical protein